MHERTYENGHHAGGVDRWQLPVHQAPPQVPDLIACKCRDKAVSENVCKIAQAATCAMPLHCGVRALKILRP